MATVASVQVPSIIQVLAVNSSDTNPIEVTPAVSGKVVRIWGFHLTGGTSMTFKSNTTAISGVLTTTGLALPIYRKGNSYVFPHYESTSGETINIVPGASGLAGTVYWSQS